MIAAGIAVVTALLAVMALTPATARIARRLGALDTPDGLRKHQIQAVPRGGGVAVAIATGLALAVALPWAVHAWGATSSAMARGLLPAALILLAVGVVDDFFSLTGIYKLIGQVLAVSVMVAVGSRFDSITILGWPLPLGSFCIPFTMFFFLGAINAFNLIDGADGLAASVGAIVSLTLGVIAATQGGLVASLLCFSMAGALLGFLRYNLPPARVYLGDTGSMFIGLVVAAVAIQCSIKQQAAFVLSVPVAICAIPILDAGAALVRRITTGQSVFMADRGHLHHALLLRGWTVGQTVALIAGLTALTCSGALASYFTSNDVFALIATVGIFGALAGARIFGHAEAALLAFHSRSLVRTIMMQRAVRNSITENSVRLQGTRKWQNVWAALREAAPTYNVAGLTLHVNMPQLHESFYANWRLNDGVALEDHWKIVLPLMLGERPIGKLTLLGGSTGRQTLVDMQQLLDYLESLEADIAQIVADNELMEWNKANIQPVCVGDGQGDELQSAGAGLLEVSQTVQLTD